MKTCSFKIDGLPPSYNRLLKNDPFEDNQRYLSMEGRIFKAKVKIKMPFLEIKDNEKLRISVMFNHKWYCKNGEIKKKDLSNLIGDAKGTKLLIDAITERLGVDDSIVWEEHYFKFHNDKETFTVVNVEILE